MMGERLMRCKILALSGALAGCVSIEIGVPAADPADHPKLKTEVPADTGVAYFLQAGKWYQLRVEIGGTEPKRKDANSYGLRLHCDTALRRYNPESEEYDLPADFVGTTPYHHIQVSFDQDKPGSISLFHGSGSEGGGGATGPRRGNYSEVSFQLPDKRLGPDGSTRPSAPKQQFAVVAAARLYPNGKTEGALRYEAKLQRTLILSALPGNKLKVTEK